MSKALLFCHPGGEHTPRLKQRSGKNKYAWNTGQHLRKFLLVHARLCERVTRTSWHSTGVREVGLWAEWEPPSLCGRFQPTDDDLLPQAWHRPLDALREKPPRGAQNTDPWVFGTTMRYSNCRQRRAALRTLLPGDVIFFGSLKRRDDEGKPVDQFNFFLDTVFVVNTPSLYSYEQRLKLSAGVEVDPLFRHAVLDRLRCSTSTRWPLTLYDGAMLSRTSQGPFSYVPCKPAGSTPSTARFRRPMINQLFDVRPGNNPRREFIELAVSADEAWKRVTRKVEAAGLTIAAEVILAS